MIPYPDTSTSKEVAVGASHIEFNAGMAAGQTYLFISSTACWIKQDTHANVTSSPATAGAGSMFVPALFAVYLNADFGDDVSVIQDAAGGKASLTHIIRG